LRVIVYHVIGAGKLRRSLANGFLPAPVRAWRTVEAAGRFSVQTGRAVILRLRFPRDAKVLPGHRGEAVFIEGVYPLDGIFGSWSRR
jgi:hypothetical protein